MSINLTSMLAALLCGYSSGRLTHFGLQFASETLSDCSHARSASKHDNTAETCTLGRGTIPLCTGEKTSASARSPLQCLGLLPALQLYVLNFKLCGVVQVVMSAELLVTTLLYVC